MTNLKKKRILVTGGCGFLGSYVFEKLIHSRGVPARNILIFRSAECDLTKEENCRKVVQKIDIVIHLAAKVGGIGFNQKFPADLFEDNLLMGVQLMRAARKAGVEKFVAIGTVCAYPKFTPVPFPESYLYCGYPEETNAPYGLAKLMLHEQAKANRKQHGFNAIYLLPVNLYGPRDNFSPKSSHVIPGLIKKVADAQEEGRNWIDPWGTGEASREFLHVEDCAEAIVLATEKYNKPEPVNIGVGKDIKIKNLVEIICRLMNFNGEIRWNKTKPDGQPERRLDTTRAEREFGFKATTDFETGLKKTIDWYLNQRAQDIKT